MKQNITIEQLSELDDKAKEKLREWWKPELGDSVMDELFCEGDVLCLGAGYECDCLTLNDVVSRREGGFKGNYTPLLNIGQMIEFIEERHPSFVLHKNQNGNIGYMLGWQNMNSSSHPYFWHEELCDTLWSAVKYILQEDK